MLKRISMKSVKKKKKMLLRVRDDEDLSRVRAASCCVQVCG